MRDLQNKGLEGLGSVPFPSSALDGELSRYSARNAKMASLVAEGTLLRLKQGLFCLSEKAAGVKPEPLLAANALYGPSYVSFETALAMYGLIPERVDETMSACAKRGKRYETPIGAFSYRTVPAEWFPIGVRTVRIDGGSFLAAVPEKALGDLLLARTNLRISSPSSLRDYLENDIRFDFDALENPDRGVLRDMVSTGRKAPLMRALERLLA